MHTNCVRAALAAVVLGLGGAGIGSHPTGAIAAETEDAVTIQVESARAKVGEQAVVVATIVPKDGFAIAGAYRNRLSNLSAADNDVKFASEVVRATLQDGTLVFRLPATPLKVGDHAINGVFRFAFVSAAGDENRLDIKSAPLVATITGTE